MVEEQVDREVFLLWHCRPLDDHPTSPDTDDKLIGVFGSETDAAEARQRVSSQPGFRGWPDAFEISRYVVGRVSWEKGFISWDEAQKGHLTIART